MEMAYQKKTAEEREAEIAALKATLDEAIEKLANDPQQWIEFLDVVSNFAARYSANNQLLILVQAQARGFMPTMVRPYGSRDKATRKPRSGWAGGWLALGRNVVKGQTGLQIWRPNMRRMSEAEAAAHVAAGGKPIRRDEKGRLPQRLAGFAIARVFDIAQTEGDDVELPPTVTVTRRVKAPGGKRPELLTGDAPADVLDVIVKLIKDEDYGFEYVTKARLGGANGHASPSDRMVRVREDVDPAQATKTAVHELAHILCGHVEAGFDYVQHRGRAETEAESVAYIVCGALGLDTERYTAPYVASWAEGDMKKVQQSAQKVIETARKILAHFDADEDQADDDTDSE